MEEKEQAKLEDENRKKKIWKSWMEKGQKELRRWWWWRRKREGGGARAEVEEGEKGIPRRKRMTKRMRRKEGKVGGKGEE